MRLNAVLLLAACLLISAPLAATIYPVLPEAVTNNAVAKITNHQGSYLLSFTGLAKNKDYRAVHNLAWSLKLDTPNAQWQTIKPVPFVAPLAGRLASTAVGVADKAYLFGGYTVAKDHQEISTVDNYQFDLASNQYQRIADMPVAVDDTSAGVYQQRFIYLFGGWHNDGNVNLVQVYDIKTNQWHQASPMPAPAVFGQAVGMIDNHVVMCDGVKVQANILKRRSYQASPVCLYGQINPKNPLRISWQKLPHFSKPMPNAKHIGDATTALSSAKPTAYYRMAATGVANKQAGVITFIGGSDNPYNYNGIGYNGKPSAANPWQYKFDIASKKWLKPTPLTTGSMDHRGLICHQQQLLRIGGMLNNQQVSNKVLSIPLTHGEACAQ
ncbi:Kelch repeat-containing protein [Shewanella intestini]|uniref:Galactose oxidase n=1 Tax=Shewanella intestini TaxID=2017544 RepID=A0ABS5I7A2_9GAMM|nr:MULTISPECIES: kelch repeat-containing protein [Shewanella]MBR9729614.1 galactose oxidase [Shewanella intestini]MRG37658.1 galactose oxidase [Shewanella sp. XMDDZSB0408]